VSETALFFAKAGRALNSAEHLIEDGDMDFAASRVYYAWFYVAEGLLLTQGLKYSRHGQVLAQYGNRFARTGLLDAEFHRLLVRAHNLRTMADYWSQADIDSETVTELIREGRRFLEAARGYLEAHPPEPQP
jgi:uncharacterized protein (UPF0332 family)